MHTLYVLYNATISCCQIWEEEVCCQVRIFQPFNWEAIHHDDIHYLAVVNRHIKGDCKDLLSNQHDHNQTATTCLEEEFRSVPREAPTASSTFSDRLSRAYHYGDYAIICNTLYIAGTHTNRDSYDNRTKVPYFVATDASVRALLEFNARNKSSSRISSLCSSK